MKKAPITILKAHLSRYLDTVKSGEEVIVTKRGQPVARLSGIDPEGIPTGRTARLVREGRMRAPTDPRPAQVRIKPLSADPEGRSLEVLLQERSEGR